MKKFFSRSDEGFTLIELMVVVAIIGILSAIAVPNFKKYQAKSKQSEAKIQLASVYTAEVGALADFDTYATCILSLGYETPARGYYMVGFTTDYAAGRTKITDAGGICTGATSTNPADPNYLKTVTGTAVALPTLAAMTQTSFVAGAAGNISSSANSVDQWTISENKNLKNPTQGY